METNKVELTGYVGRIAKYQFSLCVQETVSCVNGDVIIQQTWISVKYIDAEKLSINTKVNVIGKLHTLEYVDSERNDRKCLEVIANQVNKL